jgi:hypothetical protein
MQESGECSGPYFYGKLKQCCYLCWLPFAESQVDSPPLAFTLLSDGRLLLLALTLAAAASFVSLSIFGYTDRGRANRRTGWLLLAAVCSASGLWAAHFIALLSHRAQLPGAFEGGSAVFPARN